MLQHLKQYIPRSVKENIKLFLGFFRKPELNYIEFHLTDHCNLDCMGCGHYSPIAPPYFADIDQFKMDMRRLGQLFSNIKVIRLMGGGALATPKPCFLHYCSPSHVS